MCVRFLVVKAMLPHGGNPSPPPLLTPPHPPFLPRLLPCSCIAVSDPLLEPGPLYHPELDRVLAWHNATYSQHEWALPRLLLPHPDATTRAAVFAGALLGSKVLPGMAGLSPALVAPAASASRPELVGLARVGELLQALQAKQVCWAFDTAVLPVGSYDKWCQSCSHRGDVDKRGVAS